ncbi:MAG: cyclophilin-like fold protein [Candidatus Thermoplasmatota archaeon]
MSQKIKVSVGDVELEGELKGSKCAELIKNVLPIESDFQTWGDEFYFSIGLEMGLDETARREVDVGTIGYWPSGEALAIFFGPTPASTGEKPVAASDVNVIGKLENAEKLKDVEDTEKIKVKRG